MPCHGVGKIKLTGILLPNTANKAIGPPQDRHARGLTPPASFD